MSEASESRDINNALSQHMTAIQSQIEGSLSAIQKKMANIEQKVFATQKHMDSYAKTAQQEVTAKPGLQRTQDAPRPSGAADETI